jgi:hypothetical protein
MTDQKIERVNYNGKEYLIEDLTEPMKQEFNMLLGIQTELNRLSGLVKIQQRAQDSTTGALDALIQESGIEELPVMTVADEQLEEAHAIIDETK